MTYNPKIVEIIAKLKNFLSLVCVKEKFRISERVFCRNSGKLNFEKSGLLGICMLKKKSLSVELYNILCRILLLILR